MKLLDKLFGRPKYWAWESGDSFGFSVSTRMHALDAHGRRHRETLLKIGPWYKRKGGDDLLRTLFREKGCSALINLSESQIQRMFARSKKEMIDQFMSGYIGSEMYVIGMVLIAVKLRRKHGDLQEVRFLNDPHRIELKYPDKHTIVITEHSGHPDITMMNFGYSGTGTECLYAFLNESGFDVTMGRLEGITPPDTLKK